MAKKRKNRKPSLKSLLDTRTRMNAIEQSLRRAEAKTSELETKQKISVVEAELNNRIERLNNVVRRVNELRKRKRLFETKITEIENRTARVIERTFRSANRWLRKWERL